MVLIRLPWGETCHTLPACSLSALKCSLEEQEGIPVALQVITQSGKPMCETPFAEFPSNFEWEFRLAIDLACLVPFRFRVCPLTGDPLIVSVCVCDTVSRLKEAIWCGMGISPSEQRLRLRGKALKDSDMISDIYRPGEFVVELLSRGDAILTVKVSDETIYEIAVSETDTIDRVRERLRTQAAFESFGRVFFLADSQLDDSDTILSRQISSGTALSLSCAPSHYIWASSVGRPTAAVTVTATDTVRQLMNRLGFGQRHAVVVFKGKELDCEANLRDIGVENGSIIEYGDTLLTLRTSQFEKVALAVWSSVKIAAIKQVVAQRLLIQLEGLYLVNEGDVLQDEEPLDHYKFARDSVIEVVQQTDSYLWIKSSREKIRISVPDASITIAKMIEIFAKKSSEKCEWLTYDGRMLEPGESVSHYSLYSGAVLEAYSSLSHIVVAVSISKELVSIPVKKASTVSDLLYLLKNRLHVPSIASLYCEGKLLNQRKLLTSLTSSVISIIYNREKLLTFSYKDDSTACFPCKPSDSIVSIKEKLKWIFDIPACQLVLIYKGVILSDSTTVGAESFKDSSCIDVAAITDSFVWIKRPNQKRTYTTVKSFDISIGELKTLCDFPAQFELFFREEKLDEALTLEESSVGIGARVKLVPRNECDEEMTIVVKKRDGEQFGVTHKRSASMQQIKAAAGLSQTACLWWGEKELTERRLLTSYSIRDSCLLSDFPFTTGSCLVKSPSMPTQHINLYPGITACKARKRIRDADDTDRVYIDDRLSEDHTPVEPDSCVWLLSATDVCLRVALPRADTLVLFMSSCDSVGKLRKAVTAWMNIPSESLELKYRSVALEDSHELLSAYHLPVDCELTAMSSFWTVVTVVFAQRQATIAVSRSEMIGELEKRVEEVTKTSGRLYWQGVLLENPHTLGYYTKDRSVIIHFVGNDEQLAALHITPGETLYLAVSCKSFSALTSSVQKATNIPPALQRFSWTGPLASHTRLSVYQFTSQLMIVGSQRIAANPEFEIEIYHFYEKLFSVAVKANDSISEVKTRIRAQGLDPVHLIVSREVACDECTLQDYKVFSFTKVQMTLHGDYVATVSTPSGHTIALPFAPPSPLPRRKIAEITGIPDSLQTWFQGTTPIARLSEHKDVSLSVQPTKDLLIIETVTGSRTVFILPICSTVRCLKAKIDIAMKVMSTIQRLFFKDLLLSDERTLESYGLRPGAIVTLLLPSYVRLVVKSPLSQGFIIDEQRKKTIGELKQQIEKHVGVSNFNLIGKTEVTDDLLLSMLWPGRKALHLNLSVCSPDDTLFILIRTSEGEAFPLSVNGGDTIVNMRKMVQKTLKRVSLKLVFQGRELKGSGTVREAGIYTLAAVWAEPAILIDLGLARKAG